MLVSCLSTYTKWILRLMTVDQNMHRSSASDDHVQGPENSDVALVRSARHVRDMLVVSHMVAHAPVQDAVMVRKYRGCTLLVHHGVNT